MPLENAKLNIVELILAVATMPSSEGTKYIKLALELPARKVARSRANTSARLASSKTKCAQEVESVSIEYAIAIELEQDERVLTYWTQPPQLLLDYENHDGKRIKTTHTPDFVVQLTDGRAAIIEAKRYEEALSKSNQGSPRFKLDDNERFVDLPANQAAEDLNIPHIVITSRDISHNLVANYFFLKTYIGRETTEGAKHFADYLACHGAVPYDQSTKPSMGIWDIDDVNIAIQERLVYVDLYGEKLGSFANITVYASQALSEAAKSAPKGLPLVSNTTEPNSLSTASPAAIHTALQRYEKIRLALLSGNTKGLTTTEKKWVKNYIAAATTHGSGLTGLIPDYPSRGHRGSRLHPDIEKLLNEYVERSALEKSLSGETAAIAEFKAECEKLGFEPPSRTTFYKRLNERMAELDSIKAKGGVSAAYQEGPATPLSESATARNSPLPWVSAQLDHTPLPQKLIASFTKAPIKATPWLSIMRDTATNKVLGMHLTFDRPNSDVLFAVFWDCYKRYGRLPETLALDGEKPHDSVRVEQVLAEIGTDKISRRYKCPRDGSIVEGAFGVLMKALLDHLPGNYASRPNPMHWPEGWTPDEEAEVTTAKLWIALEGFLFHLNNEKLPQEKLGNLSPNEYEEVIEKTYGQRGHLDFTDYRDAQIAYLPTARRTGQRTLDRQHGIRIYNQPYLPIEPVAGVLYGKKFPTKYDPSDIRYALAYIDGRWIEIQHRHIHKFDGLNATELAAFSVEITEYSKRHIKDRDSRAQEFFEALDAVLSTSHDPLGDFIDQHHQANEEDTAHQDASALGDHLTNDNCGSFSE